MRIQLRSSSIVMLSLTLGGLLAVNRAEAASIYQVYGVGTSVSYALCTNSTLASRDCVYDGRSDPSRGSVAVNNTWLVNGTDNGSGFVASIPDEPGVELVAKARASATSLGVFGASTFYYYPGSSYMDTSSFGTAAVTSEAELTVQMVVHGPAGGTGFFLPTYNLEGSMLSTTYPLFSSICVGAGFYGRNFNCDSYSGWKSQNISFSPYTDFPVNQIQFNVPFNWNTILYTNIFVEDRTLSSGLHYYAQAEANFFGTLSLGEVQVVDESGMAIQGLSLEGPAGNGFYLSDANLASPTPEPAGCLLVFTGGLALFVARRFSRLA